jgi:hypothetical protein
MKDRLVPPVAFPIFPFPIFPLLPIVGHALPHTPT